MRLLVKRTSDHSQRAYNKQAEGSGGALNKTAATTTTTKYMHTYTYSIGITKRYINDDEDNEPHPNRHFWDLTNVRAIHGMNPTYVVC